MARRAEDEASVNGVGGHSNGFLPARGYSGATDLHQPDPRGHGVPPLEGPPRRSHRRNVSDEWEASKRSQKTFFDDGTMTFFWRPHTVVTLVLFCLALTTATFFIETSTDSVTNTKRGLGACVVVLVVLGLTHIPDGPFRRPHPAFWKLLLIFSILYELALIFLLFQTADDARQLLKHLDPTLGTPLPEKDYGGNCLVYDSEKPDDPFHNVRDKMDGFVLVHFFGWYAKTLVLRDYWLCTVISVMFELLEYTLDHQLPNFSECWWDHWIMDALICNGAGIYLAMKTLNYLSVKTYHWRGMWNIPTYRGKVSRVLKQFTPYFWTDFDWRPTSSLKRYISMCSVIAVFLLAELNTFYLKFVLWVPPPHFLCLGRLVFLLLWAAVGLREFYQYLDDEKCTKIGTQLWMHMVITITETMIVLKFDWDTVRKPLPTHVAILCGLTITCFVLYTLWKFYFHRLIIHFEEKIRRRKFQRGSRTQLMEDPSNHRMEATNGLHHRNGTTFADNSRMTLRPRTPRT